MQEYIQILFADFLICPPLSVLCMMGWTPGPTSTNVQYGIYNRGEGVRKNKLVGVLFIGVQRRVVIDLPSHSANAHSFRGIHEATRKISHPNILSNRNGRSMGIHWILVSWKFSLFK